jgi:hypothetical protein
MTIVQWRLRLAIVSPMVCGWVISIAISLFAFVIAIAVLVLPSLRTAVNDFQPLEAILAQLGATYGTILALVLTLSIIPIQRAGEVWSVSIIRLYRRDPITHLTFVFLGVFCAASFLLAVRGLAGIPVSIVFGLSLAILGISLDMLRWYHGHVCQLLDPTYAVGLALKRAKRAIDQTKTLVERVSRLQYQLISSSEQKNVSAEDIQGAVYPRVVGYPYSINIWINDLAEIAIKAVARSERLLAKAAVFAIADLTIHYLSSRKRNLTLTPVPEALFLAMTSDVSVVTDRTYDSLQEISRAAVNQNDESTTIRVSEAYQTIAIHTAKLDARSFGKHSAPLTFAPIYYALNCVRHAQTRNLDEVVFQTARILSGIAISAPKDTADTDIHIPVIDGLYEMAKYFYAKRNFGLAEEVNGYHFEILAALLKREDRYFHDVLRHVLKKIEMLSVLAVVNEKLSGRTNVVHPLGKVYLLTNPNSIAYLFGRAAETFPRLDPERAWINPYHELVKLADIIADHLRQVAESQDFEDSFLLWEIGQAIKHIAIVICNLIGQPLRPDHGDEDDLIDKFIRILAFYWVAFKNKKSVSGQRADDCSEFLVYIGLLFLDRDRSEILRSCISNIHSIIGSYCEIATPPNNYTIGDLLAHLWGIRLVLVARNNVALTEEVDRAISTKPRGLSDEKWLNAQRAVLLRRQQLEEQLAERDDRLRADTTKALLGRLLREAQR